AQEATRPGFVEVCAGNRVPAGAEPVSQLYAGHQFGAWVPQLGDGRAILLGQVRNRRGEAWDVQLKGAGKTPYSRFADGRAILESTLREYLVSEAMAGLGIPTTRALCVVGSDVPVYRETRHQAAVLTRLAPSHLRFGSFEVLFYREQFDRLGPLADHVIDEHFPQVAGLPPGPERYRAWVEAVITCTAELIADWQCVGFCHGVMNTDNMSILGLTIDYGPFGFMDRYQASWVCNHSDDLGRYAYDRQPAVALWNLGRFVQAVLPLLSAEPEAAVAIGQGVLASYREQYDRAWLTRMRAKLGLPDPQDADAALAQDLLARMEAGGADFTRTFRRLGRAAAGEESAFVDEFTDRDAARAWLDDWRARLASAGADALDCRATMDAVNPKYVLRNYLAEQALARAREGDYSEIERLWLLLRRPFDERPDYEGYARLPPDWASGIVLSCSA
ncbi:MAG: YdiU family protein, partial [Salinisphaera sp.]|nr:YdiU family protein [Salinisphaera sp.]